MKKKVLIPVILLTIILTAAYFWQQSTNKSLSTQEKDQAVKAMLGRGEKKEEEVVMGDSDYQGKYFNFKYPSRAKVFDPAQAPGYTNKNILETLNLDFYNPRYQLIILAGDAPSASSVLDSPGVLLRKNNPKIYKMTNIQVSNIEALVFTKQDPENPGTEKTAFLLHNHRILSLSINSESQIKEIEQLFDSAVKNLEIKD